MKISVSNIAWGKNNFNQFLSLIKENGCDGVELAPSLLWDEPKNITTKEINKLKNLLNKYDLALTGFHSLLFNRPDLLIFNEKTREESIEYLLMLIDICSELDGKQIVFGSPRNRVLCNKSLSECKKQAEEDIFRISEYGKKKNVIFCLEPLSKVETEFMTSIDEGGEFVSKINHLFFKLHIDTKAIYQTKEDPDTVITKYKNIIQHVHIGDKGLSEPGTHNMNHKEIGKALQKINYKNYLSLEIKSNDKDLENTIIRSINFIKKNYIH
jgi:sugar phosphate isomerase/epimerase